MIWLHHIGFAVKDIEKAGDFYRNTSIFDITPPRVFAEFGVKSSFITPKGSNKTIMEIVEPIDNGARYGESARQFLDEKGEGLFYFALFSDNYDNDIKDMKDKGFNLLMEEYTTFFPGYTLRLSWFDPEKIHAWVDIVDAKSVPKAAGGLAP